jgi:hypothetical protein
MIAPQALPRFRRMLTQLYAPQLQAIGFNPARGVHSADPSQRQQLRGDLVALLAGSAEHEPTRAALRQAAAAYLGGNEAALDPAFLGTALRLHVAAGGQPAAEALLAKAITSTDTRLRSAAIAAVSATGDPALGAWALQQVQREGLRPNEMVGIVGGLASRPQTREAAFNWLSQNMPLIMERFGPAAVGGMAGIAGNFCEAERADQIASLFRPLVEKYGRGALAVDRAVERVRNCAALRAARSAPLAAALR